MDDATLERRRKKTSLIVMVTRDDHEINEVKRPSQVETIVADAAKRMDPLLNFPSDKCVFYNQLKDLNISSIPLFPVIYVIYSLSRRVNVTNYY